MPPHFFHASHLAFPFMSNMPGRSAKRESDAALVSHLSGGRDAHASKKRGLAGYGRTGVDVADVYLLEPAVQLEHVLVGSLGKLVGHLHGEIELLLERHGGVDGAFENGRIGSRSERNFARDAIPD